MALKRKTYLRRKPFKRKSPTKKKKKKDVGPKPIKLKTADNKFRQVMLDSVETKCVFPNCEIRDPKRLTVSHYHGRVKKATRYSIENCDLLCRNHHYWDKQLGWEFQKQTKEEHGWDGQYTLYMKRKLGEDRFRELKELAESGMKQQVAIKEFLQKYECDTHFESI